LTRINGQEQKGLINHQEANIERNQINHALAGLIDQLDLK
jgi:hypothetical protein